MANKEQLAFLHASLERWRAQGLIDDATYQRLHADSDDVIADVIAEPPTAVLAAAITDAIAEPPTAVLAAAEQPTELDPVLAAEVAFYHKLDAQVAAAEHAAAERRAAADRVPVAERPAHLGHALLAAAAELGAMPAAHDSPEPYATRASIEQRIQDHDDLTAPPSLWDTVLRPFLVANAMWLAGALLIIAGSIYFLRLAWDHLASVPLHLVVAGVLHGYAAAFFATGYLLSRKQEAHGVGRILFAFACAILPLGSVAVGELVVVALDAWGALGAAVAVLVVAASLLVHGFILTIIAGLYERAAQRLMVTTGLALAFSTMLTALAGVALQRWAPGVAAPVLLAPLGLAALAHGFLGLPRHRVHLRMSIILFGGVMLWAFAVLLVRAQIAAPVAATHHAAILAALSALLVVTDHRLRMRASETPRLTELNIGFYVASLAAVAVALAGLGAHGYFDLWARINVLACALVATALLGQGAWRYGRTAMTWLAASAGLLVYFFVPAPFTAALRLAQEWVTAALGYTSDPLPVAFFGLLFLPYLAALGALDLRLRARHPDRADLPRDLERFAIGLSLLLVALALLGDGDTRPVLWTWPIYAAAGFGFARPLARPWLLVFGHALTLAWLGVAVTALWPTLSPAPVLAAYGALAALVLGQRRHARHLIFASLAGVVAAAAAAIVGPLLLFGMAPAWSTPVTATITAVLIALTMARLAQVQRWAWCAYAAGVTGLAASVLGCNITGRVSTGMIMTVMLAQAAVYALVAHAMRRADSAHARWRLLARPAIAVATLALLMAGALALDAHPHSVPLLIALQLAHLAWLGRGPLPMFIAAISGACAVVLAAQGLDARAGFSSTWPLALTGLGCGYLVLAAFVPPAWPRAQQRRVALALVGVFGLLWALSDTLSLAVDLGDSLAAWWRSAAELAALALVAAWLWWRPAYWQRLWGLIWPLAFVATGQAAAITLAVALSTGSNPDAAVMALMAPVALLSARALDAMAVRWRGQRDVGLMGETAFLTLLGAGVLAGASVAGCLPAVPVFVSVLGLLTLAVVTVVLVRDGMRDDVRANAAARGYLALIAVTAGYVLTRLGTGLAAMGPVFDAIAIVAAAVAALWISLRLRADSRLAMLRGPLRAAALLWPLPAAWLMFELGASARCVLGVVVAVHYAAMGRLQQRRNLTPLAMAFGNAALLLAFGALGWNDLLLYIVPVAFSALVLVHVYGPDLGQRKRNAVRAVVLMVLYLVALGQALSQATPLQSLVVVPLLCVAAIAAGTLLQVRVYVLMGVTFLAADLGVNLLRFGLQSRLLGALFLTVLGLAIVAGMVYFSVQRERLMKRYTSIVGTLRAWD